MFAPVCPHIIPHPPKLNPNSLPLERSSTSSGVTRRVCAWLTFTLQLFNFEELVRLFWLPLGRSPHAAAELIPRFFLEVVLLAHKLSTGGGLFSNYIHKLGGTKCSNGGLTLPAATVCVVSSCGLR